MKRLFIAADISDEARQIAADHIRELKTVAPDKGVSWSRPENLHITIKFLGDTEESRVPKLAETIASVTRRSRPFMLTLSDPEVIGKRVISIAVNDESGQIFDLEKSLNTECVNLGFNPENRLFYPHLTLARIRQPNDTNELIRKHRQAQIEPISFEVREIVLYESELKPAGSVYSRLSNFSFINNY